MGSQIKNINYALCVDDFGIKYHEEKDVEHLINTLRKHYEISIDKTGQNYCGLTFEWHYNEGYVDVFIPNYVKNELDKYQHKKKLHQ